VDSSDERETENLDGGLFGMATKNFNHYLTECDSSKQYDGKDVGKCEVVRLRLRDSALFSRFQMLHGVALQGVANVVVLYPGRRPGLTC